MRLLIIIILAVSRILAAAEPTYSLWNNQETVTEYAQRINLPLTKTLNLPTDIKLELVLIPAGKFTMGTPDQDPVEMPAHTVTLTKPFYMGKFVVTQEQYQAVMNANPSGFKGKDHPVETVSWDDAQAFCKKMLELTKQTVRLPSEAEWEFSCKAGTTTQFHSGDLEADLARVAWYGKNSNESTHPVGQKEPNSFGLYDMHGNVWQWCQDWYDDDYYKVSPAENPQGPATGTVHMPGVGTSRVLRGCTWSILEPHDCRSSRRWGGPFETRDKHLGFRIVLELPKTR